MVDMPGAGVAHGALHRQHAALPGRMERRLVLFLDDLTETVRAAHVVNAIHGSNSLSVMHVVVGLRRTGALVRGEPVRKRRQGFLGGAKLAQYDPHIGARESVL